MTQYKSKHISLPAETHDRLMELCKRLGCTPSKLAQIALDEHLPKWEREAGAFQLERKPVKQLILESLEQKRGMQPLARQL
ncbi:hypothetical protein [uncultured Pseudodesulfovibrio sp.]|uniref:hypothetical protein n=1 Tax=uncultured Pseudodesulfovibrio sp. TaxID=2035858 RepID=UPI0029C90612|nr:hypothetical protein [uncultured Pseudodesulfovibrio sp.]